MTDDEPQDPEKEDPEDLPTGDPDLSSVHLSSHRQLNTQINGTLTLHYDTGPLTIDDIDGDTALRVITLASRQDGAGRWTVKCDPEWDSALWAWLAVDTGGLRSVDWRPRDIQQTPASASEAAPAGATWLGGIDYQQIRDLGPVNNIITYAWDNPLFPEPEDAEVPPESETATDQDTDPGP